MVMQELNPVPSLSVAENLFLKRLPRNPVGWIAKGRLREQARATMTHVGLDAFDLD
jgi:ribose transport system ATP-binding protein